MNQHIALVSMPWMAPNMPSIQLATIKALLERAEMTSDVHELYLDYARQIGVNIYNLVSSSGGFIEEWVFAQDYYRREHGISLNGFRSVRPRLGLVDSATEDRVLDALIPITEEFMDQTIAAVNWGTYDIVGVSLTISQTAASMALARAIKRHHPAVTIVFGGASCAGPMGPALLRACPYVDVVVGVEAELVFIELIKRLRDGQLRPGSSDSEGTFGLAPDSTGASAVNELPGVSLWLNHRIVSGPLGTVHRPTERLPLDYDHYFERLNRLNLGKRADIWLPFESSRGCWYGEKTQCSFCGLHEIMTYRSMEWEATLMELERLHRRYHVKQFFSVDLIMPREYPKTLLPELARRELDFSLFYEIKANMKREELELLAAGGVKWVQPGLESLDDHSLKVMRKGVTVLQNVQLLKWCAALGIRVTWNIITGMPGERPDTVETMCSLIPSLYHLDPPSGAATFELHRFSPMFENPAEFGIERCGAHPLYREVFPIASDVLDALVYRHHHRRPDDHALDFAPLHQAIRQWKAARTRGATLRLVPQQDGLAEIIDTRGEHERRFPFNSTEAYIYQSLDSMKTLATLRSNLAQTRCKGAQPYIDSDTALEVLIRSWKESGLVLEQRARLLALATLPPQAKPLHGSVSTQLEAPVPYLVRGRGSEPSPVHRLPLLG